MNKDFFEIAGSVFTKLQVEPSIKGDCGQSGNQDGWHFKNLLKKKVPCDFLLSFYAFTRN